LSAVLEVAEHSSVAAAMNQGSPLTESSPQSPIAHAFYDFADQILGLDESKSRRRLRIGGRA
jgi:MinD-like ATPase involved in chromosome partitioning or flagellar assembly